MDLKDDELQAVKFNPVYIRPAGMSIDRSIKSKYQNLKITLKVLVPPNYEYEYEERQIMLSEMTDDQRWLLDVWEQLNNRLLMSLGIDPVEYTEDLKDYKKRMGDI